MSRAESERVVIGMDPHKRSATIGLMTANVAIEGDGRFGTDRDGYAAMLRYGRRWPDRVWAIEGCAGIGKHIANRLLADGEQVVDVPPKLSARAGVRDRAGRKTDATDAHSVAGRHPDDPGAAGGQRRAARGAPGWSKSATSPGSRTRPLRVLERHRTSRRLLRRPGPPSTVAGREPADQAGPAHHGPRPDPQLQRGRAYYDRKKADGKAPMEELLEDRQVLRVVGLLRLVFGV
jgi:hypothetical protein